MSILHRRHDGLIKRHLVFRPGPPCPFLWDILWSDIWKHLGHGASVCHFNQKPIKPKISAVVGFNWGPGGLNASTSLHKSHKKQLLTSEHSQYIITSTNHINLTLLSFWMYPAKFLALYIFIKMGDFLLRRQPPSLLFLLLLEMESWRWQTSLFATGTLPLRFAVMPSLFAPFLLFLL